MIPFVWTTAHVQAIDEGEVPVAPVIGADAAERIVPNMDLWDHWPVLEEDGTVAEIAGGVLAIALSAPVLFDPEERHAVARLRLLHRYGTRWTDLGPLLPDGLNPGSREWAGCATVDAAHNRLTLHFTAAGYGGERVTSFDQRLFVTTAVVKPEGDLVRLNDWTRPLPTVIPDGRWYETDMAGGGAIGTIKAFRDPFAFSGHDAKRECLLFSGSRANAHSAWNGVVGLAFRLATGWQLSQPVVDATGLNNELERPHAIAHGGLVYLFWSTQAKIFAVGGPAGPTGLYGVVGPSIDGPWTPLNGTCLVIANPPEAPAQAYSWQVLPDLTVWSFADLVGLSRRPADVHEARAHFAGTPAPVLRLALAGERAILLP